MDHLHHDSHVLLGGGAQVVFDVALSLQLEHHFFYGHALPTDAAELVPKPVGHAFESIFDKRLSLRVEFASIVEERHADFLKPPNLARVILEALEHTTAHITSIHQAMLDLGCVLQRQAPFLDRRLLWGDIMTVYVRIIRTHHLLQH